jgi:hypothetical protein
MWTTNVSLFIGALFIKVTGSILGNELSQRSACAPMVFHDARPSALSETVSWMCASESSSALLNGFGSVLPHAAGNVLEPVHPDVAKGLTAKDGPH